MLGLAATLTIGAGLVRRWREANRMRRGQAPPLGPAMSLPTLPRGSTVGRLGSWVPPRPASSRARLAAAAWAGPLTTVGGLVTALGGARASWDPVRGCWVATDVGGPSAWLLGLLDLDANTMGHVVVVRTERASPRLLDHEAVHVRQSEWLGPLLPVLYAVLSARYGYRDNPLEQAARRGAAAATGRP